MFSYEYCVISKNTYFEEHLRTAAVIFQNLHYIINETYSATKVDHNVEKISTIKEIERIEDITNKKRP